MTAARNYVYQGVRQAPAAAKADAWTRPEPYLPTEDLKRAVNLAIFLERPLLLEGEAGCGKSRLAYAVAYELGLPLHVWPVRSGSSAREGLYTYDAMARLHDIQVTERGQPLPAPLPGQPQRDPANPATYRKFGALGKAFMQKAHPSVVLIDEIDKADLDFPNDLLTVLDDPWSFDIPETGERIEAGENARPIVIITSNKEKGNLPAPFLRRCIYHFVRFPDEPDRLREIVQMHYKNEDGSLREPDVAPPDDDLVNKAVDYFRNLRTNANLHKKPGTSELRDWVRALYRFGETPHTVNLDDPAPYPELLFKLRVDFQAHTGMTRPRS